MDTEGKVHDLINELAHEVFLFIKLQEASYEERWVPATHVKDSLNLNFVAVPKENIQYGAKGWLFAILARILEDKDLVDYKKVGSRAFYRSK
jgi:hypothetical protein